MLANKMNSRSIYLEDGSLVAISDADVLNVFVPSTLGLRGW